MIFIKMYKFFSISFTCALEIIKLFIMESYIHRKQFMHRVCYKNVNKWIKGIIII